jgi:hypothetical protein
MAYRWLAGLVGLVVSASGCGLVTDEDACTLIGCGNGLHVELEGATDGPVRVVVTLPDGTKLEERCDGAARCLSGIVFEDVTATSVVIDVYLGSDEPVRFAEQLTYDQYFPNGEDCGPPCRLAKVHLAPPG